MPANIYFFKKQKKKQQKNKTCNFVLNNESICLHPSTSLVACIGWVVYFKNSVPSSYIGIKESNMIEYLQF